ncbi:MAG: DUF3303 family protein [Acidobacteriales bacterium]|nr:DUF3303 family protein [Terriglobales bacterium]
MLLMVIERFKNGDPLPVRDRFQSKGRMLPGGVTYISSWIDAANARCFQLMEADSAAALQPWIDRWADLVEFEVVPVQTSQAIGPGWKRLHRWCEFRPFRAPAGDKFPLSAPSRFLIGRRTRPRDTIMPAEHSLAPNDLIHPRHTHKGDLWRTNFAVFWR